MVQEYAAGYVKLGFHNEQHLLIGYSEHHGHNHV
jgi:hypothetical protein